MTIATDQSLRWGLASASNPSPPIDDTQTATEANDISETTTKQTAEAVSTMPSECDDVIIKLRLANARLANSEAKSMAHVVSHKSLYFKHGRDKLCPIKLLRRLALHLFLGGHDDVNVDNKALEKYSILLYSHDESGTKMIINRVPIFHDLASNNLKTVIRCCSILEGNEDQQDMDEESNQDGDESDPVVCETGNVRVLWIEAKVLPKKAVNQRRRPRQQTTATAPVPASDLYKSKESTKDSTQSTDGKLDGKSKEWVMLEYESESVSTSRPLRPQIDKFSGNKSSTFHPSHLRW